MSKAKWIIFALVLVGSVSTGLGAGRETFLKRVEDSKGMAAGLAEWEPALKNATGEQVAMFALLVLLGQLDPLWNKENKFNKEASTQLVGRVKAVNQDTLALWQAALEKATGDKPSKTDTVLFIIQQDQIFDKATVKEQESAASLSRLKSVPENATRIWADLTKKDRLSAVENLIRLDPVFEKNAFLEPSFKKLCEEVKAKQN